MIVLCRPDATPEQRDRILAAVQQGGAQAFVRQEGGRTVVEAAAAPDARRAEVERLPGVERVFGNEGGAHLATREHRSEPTRVALGDAVFGGAHAVVVAGPCAVEDQGVLLEVAHAVRAAGAEVLRGGAYKPRT
jgi:3-deoxy-7-phosphoheptulonate synthase